MAGSAVWEADSQRLKITQGDFEMQGMQLWLGAAARQLPTQSYTQYAFNIDVLNSTLSPIDFANVPNASISIYDANEFDLVGPMGAQPIIDIPINAFGTISSPTFRSRGGNVVILVHIMGDKTQQANAGVFYLDNLTLNLVQNSVTYTCEASTPNTQISTGTYRYGFNGMEKEEELTPLPYDFGNRLYDPRRGQFPTTDRLASKYPHQSPYVFAGNTPIQAIDVDGDAAWVVIKTTIGDKTQIQMKFDKDLVNPGGLYYIHRWVDPNNPSFITSVSSGSQLYSEYPTYFPNFAKGIYDKFDVMDIVKSFSLEGEFKILFGDAGLEGVFVGERVGGSVGFEGNLFGFEANTEKGFDMTSSFHDGEITVNPGFSVGSGVGVEVRKEWNVMSGTTKETEVKASLGLGTIKKVGIDATVKNNGKIGLEIGGKVALGFGVKFETRANVNVNKLKAAIKPLTIPFTSYESEMQDNPEQGTKSFDPDCY